MPETDPEVVAIAELYDAAFKALRREHRCRKNALEAVEKMRRIVHQPTPREMAQVRFLDNAHTVAWSKAEELLVQLAELEGGNDAGAELLEGDEAPAPAS